jgi:hypothetical protein
LFSESFCCRFRSRAVWGVCLPTPAYWNCGFESLRVHWYLSLVNSVCFEVGVSA